MRRVRSVCFVRAVDVLVVFLVMAALSVLMMQSSYADAPRATSGAHGASAGSGKDSQKIHTSQSKSSTRGSRFLEPDEYRWRKQNNRLYGSDKQGKPLVGWQCLKSAAADQSGHREHWFYFGQDGQAYTGLHQLKDRSESRLDWFCFDENTGELFRDRWSAIRKGGTEKWYYHGADGATLSGLHRLKGGSNQGQNWFYFNHDTREEVRNGWSATVKGGVEKWYYHGGDGAALTGQHKLVGGFLNAAGFQDEQWFYFDEATAEEIRGWKGIEAQQKLCYYRDGDGAMLKGSHVIDGETYHFDKVTGGVALMRGIDIANWQKGIDISKVESDFVIMKATEGTWYTNEMFWDQERGYRGKWADEVLRLGKKLGLYHFINGEDPIEQAKHFCEKVRPYLGRAVLVLDWENNHAGSRGSVRGDQDFHVAQAFLDYVERNTGVRPVIYMQESFARLARWNEVAKNTRLWLASYRKGYAEVHGHQIWPWKDQRHHKTLGHWKQPTMFQYTSKGKLPGYQGFLVLDVFYGDRSMWDRLAARK